jgi:hypothetical protein
MQQEYVQLHTPAWDEIDVEGLHTHRRERQHSRLPAFPHMDASRGSSSSIAIAKEASGWQQAGLKASISYPKSLFKRCMTSEAGTCLLAAVKPTTSVGAGWQADSVHPSALPTDILIARSQLHLKEQRHQGSNWRATCHCH